ncbi:hypothetical protein DFP72DRAFT_880172 [Ephemerocybe angulata]|uniref:SET domain-containing protein n=1 Tax=Ephemerocybe angulata TaxID=980116 RepID=A0A8H6I8Z4_9AGAR|nr:hypothetical protein DFP72DRAFT_880172 [Tulosesus angulatus]
MSEVKNGWAHEFALHLSEGAPVDSAHAVGMEDLVIQALFAPCKPANRRTHTPQTLGLSFKPSGNALLQLYSAFETHKSLFQGDEPWAALIGSQRVRESLEGHGTDPYFANCDKAALDILQWLVAAYGVLLNSRSLVKLRVTSLDDGSHGFALYSRHDIAAGEYIWEALGKVPADNLTSTSSLSMIRTTAKQNQAKGQELERVLYGPARMINHRCKMYNVALATHDGTSAFVIYALRPITAGEELTLNYGRAWFGPSCPCADCVLLKQVSGHSTLANSETAKSDPPPTLAALEDRHGLVSEMKKQEAERYREERRREVLKNKEQVKENKKIRRRRNRMKKQMARDDDNASAASTSVPVVP